MARTKKGIVDAMKAAAGSSAGAGRARGRRRADGKRVKKSKRDRFKVGGFWQITD